MTLTTYVNFSGTCAEAFHYYEQHLGAKIGMMLMHQHNPDPAARERGESMEGVLHARIAIGGTELAGADVPHAEPMRSAYLTLHTETDSEAERLYAALSAGGRVLMPMQETFFASRFGQVRDRFGLNWLILHELPRSAS